METKTCVVCGREFSTARTRKICCSPECSKAHKRKIDRHKNRRAGIGGMARIRAKAAERPSLGQIAAEARSRGMSYGQYVAWLNQQGAKA